MFIYKLNQALAMLQLDMEDIKDAILCATDKSQKAALKEQLEAKEAEFSKICLEGEDSLLNIVKAQLNSQAKIAAMEEELDRIKTMIDVEKSQLEFYKSEQLNFLRITGQTRVPTILGTASITRRENFVIDDETLIPDSCKKEEIKVKIDKTKLNQLAKEARERDPDAGSYLGGHFETSESVSLKVPTKKKNIA